MGEAFDVDKLNRVYLRIREAKKLLVREHEAKVAELDGQMQTIENMLLGILNRGGMTSAATKSGTAYVEEVVKPTVQDWELYYGWMSEQGSYEGLEKRVARNFIADWLKDHDGEPPPGVKVAREKVVRVRVANS